MAFSRQTVSTIDEFAASMNVVARPAVDGSYSFVFERSGTLTFTSSPSGDATLLSLHVPLRALNEDMELRLVRLAGPEISTDRFLSVGVTRDGGAMLVVKIGDDEMSLPQLETCLQQLLAARAALP
ncbi:hypothetical protein [Mesorhizobium sp. ANAO-SY3R2]|uniref:hypothetical protein n=1 Tax=Mesorhizobium sp. ANAO-SY3R2 TaxID=3166644 RepID=UPI00366D9FDA